MTPRFITLEGGEGVGKSTQLARLAEALRGRGVDLLTTREPGGSPGAEAIRQLILTGDDAKITPRAEALMFAAARTDHVQRTIRPALAQGRWVLCDRYLDSSRAYQGVAGSLGDADILAMHQLGSGGFLPDRTLVLDLPDSVAADRADRRDGGAADRIGGRGSDYHGKVRQAFRNFAAAEPERFRLIDASGTPDNVSARLMAALSDYL